MSDLNKIVNTPKGMGIITGYDESGKYFVALESGMTTFFDKSRFHEIKEVSKCTET